ncbi:centromere protein P [Polymixia lowei]
MNDNMKQVSVLEAQVQALQAEIAALQGQQDNNINIELRGRMQDALLALSGKQRGEGSRGLEIVASLRAEVEELEEDLNRQTQINGITLTSCTTKTLQNNESGLQQYCVKGHCSQMFFQLEFQVSEVKKEQSCERTITDLNIVMDTGDLQDFSSWLSGVEENRDLLLFFRTLRRFSDRCDDRCRTFQHFQEKYPTVVSLPGGCWSEIMTLHHPQLPGCVLLVHWSVQVSKEGEVTPKIDLLPKIPQTALQLDSARTLEGAPAAFQSLLRLLGTEAALESTIMSVSTST